MSVLLARELQAVQMSNGKPDLQQVFLLLVAAGCGPLPRLEPTPLAGNPQSQTSGSGTNPQPATQYPPDLAITPPQNRLESSSVGDTVWEDLNGDYEFAEPEERKVWDMAVAVTGEGDRQACFEAGMDEYLTKPIRPDDLFSLVERLVQKAASAAVDEPAGPVLA